MAKKSLHTLRLLQMTKAESIHYYSSSLYNVKGSSSAKVNWNQMETWIYTMEWRE